MYNIHNQKSLKQWLQITSHNQFPRKMKDSTIKLSSFAKIPEIEGGEMMVDVAIDGEWIKNSRWRKKWG